MKHLSLILAVCILSAVTASAQMHQGMHNQSSQNMGTMGNPGMMGYNHMGYNNMGYNNMGNMMYGNMYGMMMPMQEYTFMINTMPQMYDQLGLTTEQSDKLLDLRTEFMKQKIDLEAQYTKKQMTLENQLEENAPADQVKTQLESCAQTQTDMELAAYQSGMKMRNILNDSQKKKLDNLLTQCLNGNCMMGGFNDTDTGVN